MSRSKPPGVGASKYSDADLPAAIETAAKRWMRWVTLSCPSMRLEKEYRRRGLARGASYRGGNSGGPRFLTDLELRLNFGLSERALTRLRASGHFPSKDDLVGKTDRKLVDAFFDRRAGLAGESPPEWEQPDGKESFQ